MSSKVVLTLKEIITDNSKTYALDDIKSIMEIKNDVTLIDSLLCLLKEELNCVNFETMLSDQLVIDNIYYYISVFITNDLNCDIEKLISDLNCIQSYIDDNSSPSELKTKKSPDKMLKIERAFWKSLSTYNTELINKAISNKKSKIQHRNYNFIDEMIFNIKNFYLLQDVKEVLPCLFLERDVDGVSIFIKSFNFYLKLLADENAELSDIIYFEKVMGLFLTIRQIQKNTTVTNKILLTIDHIKRKPNMCKKIKKQRIYFLTCLNNEFLTKKINKNNIHIPTGGSEEIEVYLKEIPNYYHDFTDKQIYTIDKASSIGLDDAISLQKLNNNNYLLGVYITDVSSQIPIDFCNDITILNYGEIIYSQNKETFQSCSLLPGDVKKTVVYFFEIEPDGNIKRYFFTKGIIKTRNSFRLSYDEVNNILNSGCDDQVMYKTLSDLYKLSDLLNICKKSSYNKTQKKQLGSENMISKFSILANHTAASHAQKIGVPFLYRNHQNVEIDDVLMNYPVLNKMVCDHGKSKKDVNLEYMISTNFSRSYYSTKPLPHEGLGLDIYSHTTSPLRRYADLENQRLINLFFINKVKDDKIFYQKEERLKKISELLNAGTIIPEQEHKEEEHVFIKCL